MKAAVLTAPEVLEIQDLPEPTSAADSLVAIDSVGICGTDVSIYKGKIPVQLPRVLGHEIVGRVVEAGNSTDALPVGTRVLVDPSSACRRCRECVADREHLCSSGALLGRDRDGGFAEVVAVQDLRLIPIPEDLPRHEAELLQVLGTCVHAHSTFEMFPGQTGAVVGLGVAGFLMIELLRARGVDNPLGVTRSSWKASLGEKLGAVVVTPDDAMASAAALTQNTGFDVVIEAAGTPESMAQAMHLAAPGGTVVVFGTIGRSNTHRDTLPHYDMYLKELTVRYPRAARLRDYERGVALVQRKAIDVAPLWSRSYPLESATDAMNALADPETLKVTLDVSATPSS